MRSYLVLLVLALTACDPGTLIVDGGGEPHDAALAADAVAARDVGNERDAGSDAFVADDVGSDAFVIDAFVASDVGSDAFVASDVGSDAFVASDVGNDAFACPTGMVVSGAACVPIGAPRPIAPLSTASASSRRPTLSWSLADGTDGAHVELCADRACTMSIATFDATGTRAMPPSLPQGVVFWRLTGRAAGVTGTAVSPTWQLSIPVSDAPHDASWGSIFDVNGDGYGDPLAAGANGRIFLFRGGELGVTTSYDLVLDGGSASVLFGAFASAGDVDGDGFSDLVVAAEATTSHDDFIYVFRGSASGLVTPAAWIIADPSAMGDGFGASVASAGDVDGDGYADVIVGASLAHHAYVFGGSADGISATPSQTFSESASQYGESVAGGFDVDGDGLSDVAVGAGGESTGGGVWIYSGLGDAATSFPGNSSDGRFGRAIANAGDVDGNGYPDLVVGAPGIGGGEGRAYVFLLSSGGAAIGAPVVQSAFGELGAVVAGAGDVNGDGFDDVIAGAPGFNSNAGQLYIFTGSASGAVIASPIYGASFDTSTTARWASAVAGVGDTNGDHLADIAVGSPAEFSYRGTTCVLRGNATTRFNAFPGPRINGPDAAPGSFGAYVAGRD